jgi:hypothetical protein
MRIFCLLCALVLSSCVLGGEPVEIPQAPPPPPPVVTPPAPEPVREVPVPFEVQPIVAWTTPPEFVKPAKPAGKGTKPAHEPSPVQVIQEAQKEARVAPTKRGYFGGRGVHRYVWMPYKIYDVYLTPGAQTRIELPPGETLAHALILNPRSFSVKMATIGTEVTANTIILIRPCAKGEGEDEDACLPSPSVDVALTSASGRSYDLHLIIGQVGMLGVTWELVPIPLVQVEEPGTVPRRQP